MDSSTWIPLAAAAIFMVLGFLGLKTVVKNAAKEVSDFVLALSAALQDDKITSEEITILKKELADIKAAIDAGKQINKKK